MFPIGAHRVAAAWVVTLCVCADAAPAPAVGQRVYRVRDFGASADSQMESRTAIRAAIQAAIAAEPGTEVLLEAGTYYVKPDASRPACFAVERATNLIVRGSASATKLVVTDPAAGAFAFSFCREVALRDLTVDYDPVPFCQGIIRAVDTEACWFDLEVEPGFLTLDAENFLKAHEPYGKWGMILAPATRRIRTGTPDHYMTPRWEARGGRVWRFFTTAEHHRRGLAHMRVGDAYVHLARGHASVVFAQRCDGVRIENVFGNSSIPGQACEHEADHGKVNRAFAGLRHAFVVAVEAAITAQPAEGVPHHPAPRLHTKRACVGAFDDLDGTTPETADPPRQRTRIATIGPDVLEAAVRRAGKPSGQQLLRAVSILNVRRQDHHQQDQAQGIYQDMALASVDFLAGIAVPRVDAFGVLDTLSVDNRRAGVPFTPFHQADVLTHVSRNAVEQAAACPEAAVVIYHAPRHEVFRQVAPLTGCVGQAEQGIEQFPIRRLALAPRLVLGLGKQYSMPCHSVSVGSCVYRMPGLLKIGF